MIINLKIKLLLIGSRYADPVLKNCVECSTEYRTYVPGTSCILPDGGIQCHQEPQLSCPDCDFTVIGAMLNMDLFPHLQSQVP